jgi:hypothetical protein
VQDSDGNTSLAMADMTATSQTSNGFTRYVATFTMAADASTDYLEVALQNQNGALMRIAGCQLEPGPVATPFEHRPIGTELALCQRYYFSNISGRPYQFGFGNGSTGWMSGSAGLPQSMRATPTVVLYGNSGANDIGFLGPDGLNLGVASGTDFRLGTSAFSTETIPVQARSQTTTVQGFWFGLTANAEL